MLARHISQLARRATSVQAQRAVAAVSTNRAIAHRDFADKAVSKEADAEKASEEDTLPVRNADEEDVPKDSDGVPVVDVVKDVDETVAAVQGVEMTTGDGSAHSYSSRPHKLATRPEAKFKIETPGLAALLHIEMPSGVSIKTARGRALGMARQIEGVSELNGGVVGGLVKFLAGGHYYVERYHAPIRAGNLILAPPNLGDIAVISMDGKHPLNIRLGSFLAASEHVHLHTRTAFWSTVMTGGSFVTRVDGEGQLAIHAFGAIARLSLGPADDYMVDKKYLIAWHADMAVVPPKSESFSEKLSFWKPTDTSKDMVLLSGPGDFYIQSRHFDKVTKTMKEKPEDVKKAEQAMMAREATSVTENQYEEPQTGFSLKRYLKG